MPVCGIRQSAAFVRFSVLAQVYYYRAEGQSETGGRFQQLVGGQRPGRRRPHLRPPVIQPVVGGRSAEILGLDDVGGGRGIRTPE